MKILNINKQQMSIILTFHDDIDCSPIYLYGENLGQPVIKELDKNFLESNIFKIEITYNTFKEMIIEENFKLQLCTDFSGQQLLDFSQNLLGSKYMLSYGIYTFEFVVNTTFIGFIVQSIPIVFRGNIADSLSDECVLEINIPQIAVDGEKKCQIILFKRITEILWQYPDKKIILYEIFNSGMQRIYIPYKTIFSSQILAEWYDIKVCVCYKNMKSEYFLYDYIDIEAVNTIKKSVVWKRDNKKLTLNVYKSAGKNISLSLIGEYLYMYNISRFEVLHNRILLGITRPSKNEKEYLSEAYIVFKKRIFSNLYGNYNKIFKKKLNIKNGEYIFEESADEFLKNYITAGDEHWDIFIEDEQKRLYPINGTQHKKSEYFDAAGGYKICFFNGQGHALAIYTHEGDHLSNKKIKVSVLGTCFTRSVFRSEPYFNADYKRFYDCVYTQFHSSLISLASKPCLEQLYNIDELNKEEKLYLPTEVNKDFFEKLRASNAEYLIIDNYCDALRPIIEIDQGRVYITYNKYFVQNNKLLSLSKFRMINPGTDEHYILYNKYAKIFIDETKKIIPEDHIILLAARQSYYKIDEKNQKKEPWNNRSGIARNNYLWDKIDMLLLSIAPNIRVIDMRNTRFASDLRSPIPGGASASHYQKYYYREILDKLNKIVLEDKVTGK